MSGLTIMFCSRSSRCFKTPVLFPHTVAIYRTFELDGTGGCFLIMNIVYTRRKKNKPIQLGKRQNNNKKSIGFCWHWLLGPEADRWGLVDCVGERTCVCLRVLHLRKGANVLLIFSGSLKHLASKLAFSFRHYWSITQSDIYGSPFFVASQETKRLWR